MVPLFFKVEDYASSSGALLHERCVHVAFIDDTPTSTLLTVEGGKLKSREDKIPARIGISHPQGRESDSHLHQITTTQLLQNVAQQRPAT